MRKYPTKKLYPAVSRSIRQMLHRELVLEKRKDKGQNQASIRRVIDLLKKNRDLTDEDLPIVRNALNNPFIKEDFEDWIRRIYVADTFSNLGD